jgi:SET domain-containing protein
VFIHAKRAIAAGEELFYDYGLVLDEPMTPQLRRDYQCLCAARHCRGVMLAPTHNAA